MYKELGKEGIELAKNHMQELVKLYNNKNIQLTIVVYPWAGMINNHKRQLIDLFAVFFQQVEQTSYEQVSKTYFIKGDGHCNAEKHKLVKQTIQLVFEKSVLEMTQTNNLNENKQIDNFIK